jgi:chromosome segregation ATPase
MDAETWMDAATAKAEGFADAIIKELALAALYKASYMEENKPVEVAEVAAPETVEEVVETPAETVAETTVIEQEVEVTATDMVNAALGKKKRVSFDVSAHFTSAINALADEVKEKGDALAEAEAEVVRLKEQIEALQSQAVTAETEATTAKAEAEAVKAMFEQVKSELAQVSAEPVTPAAEAAKSEGAAAVPGKMIPEGKQTKKQQYESKVAELYGHFVPNKTKA